MDKQVESLLKFLNSSPCNFFAVNTAKNILKITDLLKDRLKALLL